MMRRLARAFCRILDMLLAGPDRAVCEWPNLTGDD